MAQQQIERARIEEGSFDAGARTPVEFADTILLFLLAETS